MVELLAAEEKGAIFMMKDVQQIFADEFSQDWAISTLTRHLGAEYSWQKASFKDPQKWLPPNCVLIKDFALWWIELPVQCHYQVKVFDEACIDRTNLGNLIIWSWRGQ
jgi:hypothetical protein